MSQTVFEFFVFQPGGLVLWPRDCTASRTVHVVSEFVHRQIELRNSEESIRKDQVYAVAKRSSESGLFFCITVPFQISQHAQYLPQMLDDFIDTFEHQFEPILARSQQLMLVPDLFAPFEEDGILRKFQGQTSQPSRKPNANIESLIGARTHAEADRKDKMEKPKKEKPKKEKKGFDRLDRQRDDKQAEEMSTVIGQSRAQAVDVKQYDLDDFQGVFAPSQTNASKLGSLFQSIVGEKVLTDENLDPVLKEFEQHLINKNVANHIAAELTKAVGKKLNGSKCGTFSSVKKIVVESLRESIERILTPHRSLDLIRDIQNARANGVPYVLTFVGVNGVGKTTSISKITYLLKSHGFKILITACDTFRNGAVDQLEVHSKRLGVELFQRGGGRRDPVPVAKDAVSYAKANKFDVVLIDTAGRMQNDTNLMKQIARLINEVKPDLTVFVAEALVGNNGADQIKQFDATLRQHNGVANASEHGIDGIVLTKFDTIDDKVGASLTLVYETGHPIIYLGVGQQYHDLRRMKPEFVVSTLLNGF